MNTSSARKESLFEENKGLFGPGRAGYPGEVFKESLFDIDNETVKAHPGAVFEVIQGGLSKKGKKEDLLEYEQSVSELMSAQRDRLGTVLPKTVEYLSGKEEISKMIGETLNPRIIYPVRPTNSRRHAKVRPTTPIAELDEPFSDEVENAA